MDYNYEFPSAKKCGKIENLKKNSTTNIESGRKHLPCDRELQLVPQYQTVSSGTMHTSNVLQTDQVVCRPIHIHVHIHVCI